MSREIAAFIKEHEDTIGPLYKDYSLKFWELSRNGDAQREKELVESKERYLKVYADKNDFKQLRAWKEAASQLPEIEARQYRLIHDTYVPNQIEENVLRDI